MSCPLTGLVIATSPDIDAFLLGSHTATRVCEINDGEWKTTVLTAIIERPPEFAGTGPLRVALAAEWIYQDDRWLLQRITTAWVLAEDFLEPSDEVKAAMFPDWEPY